MAGLSPPSSVRQVVADGQAIPSRKPGRGTRGLPGDVQLAPAFELQNTLAPNGAGPGPLVAATQTVAVGQLSPVASAPASPGNAKRVPVQSFPPSAVRSSDQASTPEAAARQTSVEAHATGPTKVWAGGTPRGRSVQALGEAARAPGARAAAHRDTARTSATDDADRPVRVTANLPVAGRDAMRSGGVAAYHHAVGFLIRKLIRLLRTRRLMRRRTGC